VKSLLKQSLMASFVRGPKRLYRSPSVGCQDHANPESLLQEMEGPMSIIKLCYRPAHSWPFGGGLAGIMAAYCCTIASVWFLLHVL
jgi:hypothetical protein